MENNEQYFNTINESGDKLKNRVFKANKQSGIILNFFKKQNKYMRPSEVHYSCFDENTPITSVRRSINVLTNAGLLVKTSMKDIGPFGSPEHYWRLVDNFELALNL